MIRLRRLFLLTFIAELLVFAIISALPIKDPALYTSFKSQDSVIVSKPYFSMWLSIFPHNLEIASFEFVPIVGPAWFAFSMVTTSVVVAVEGTATHISGFFIFLSLMMLPHSWLELPAYAVAVSTSIYLLYYIIKRYPARKYLKLLYMYFFVVIELAFAGAIESAEIILEESAHPLYAFYMWLPSIPIIIFLIMLYRYIDRDEYNRKKEEESVDDIFNMQ